MAYKDLTSDELIDKLSGMIDRQLVKGFQDNADLLVECRRRLIIAQGLVKEEDWNNENHYSSYDRAQGWGEHMK